MKKHIYKVGEKISDEHGFKEVIEISNDGYVTFVNEDADVFSIYYHQHDRALGKGKYRGVIVKLSNNKNFKGYTEYYFNNKANAKYWGKNQNGFYRVEEAVLIKCKTCNKVRRASVDVCEYCDKMRSV